MDKQALTREDLENAAKAVLERSKELASTAATHGKSVAQQIGEVLSGVGRTYGEAFNPNWWARSWVVTPQERFLHGLAAVSPVALLPFVLPRRFKLLGTLLAAGLLGTGAARYLEAKHRVPTLKELGNTLEWEVPRAAESIRKRLEALISGAT